MTKEKLSRANAINNDINYLEERNKALKRLTKEIDSNQTDEEYCGSSYVYFDGNRQDVKPVFIVDALDQQFKYNVEKIAKLTAEFEAL